MMADELREVFEKHLREVTPQPENEPDGDPPGAAQPCR